MFSHDLCFVSGFSAEMWIGREEASMPSIPCAQTSEGNLVEDIDHGLALRSFSWPPVPWIKVMSHT